MCPRDREQDTEADAQQMKGKHGELNEGVGLGKAHIIWGLSENAKEFVFYANCQGRRRNFQLRCNLVFMIKKLFWLLGEKPIIVRRS